MLTKDEIGPGKYEVEFTNGKVEEKLVVLLTVKGRGEFLQLKFSDNAYLSIDNVLSQGVKFLRKIS